MSDRLRRLLTGLLRRIVYIVKTVESGADDGLLCFARLATRGYCTLQVSNQPNNWRNCHGRVDRAR